MPHAYLLTVLGLGLVGNFDGLLQYIETLLGVAADILVEGDFLVEFADLGVLELQPEVNDIDGFSN